MPPIKRYGQNSEKMYENVKKNPPIPSLNFVHNFLLEAFKRILEDEI